jgi:hypothetical protein
MSSPTRVGALTLLSLSLVAALAGSACRLLDCDVLDCPDGIRVEVEGAGSTDVMLRLTAAGEERVQECRGPGDVCATFFPDWMPQQVTIEVTYPAGSYNTAVTPLYQGLYLNGQRCGVTCTQANVSIEI